MRVPEESELERNRLEHELNELPEKAVTDDLQMVEMALDLFENNGSELLSELDKHATPEVVGGLFSPSRRHELDDLRRLTTRLLHNYLASAATLRDLCRNITCAWKARLPEYQARVTTEFANDSLSRFVHELRNYSLHNKLPLVSSNLHIRFQPIRKTTSGIMLSRDTLREGAKWTTLARLFLDQSDSAIDLRSVVQNYTAKVQSFYSWFRAYFSHAFAAEIAVVSEKKATLARVAAAGTIRRFETWLPTCKRGPVPLDDLLANEVPEGRWRSLVNLSAVERYEAAIQAIEEQVRLPDDLKTRMRRLYGVTDQNARTTTPGSS